MAKPASHVIVTVVKAAVSAVLRSLWAELMVGQWTAKQQRVKFIHFACTYTVLIVCTWVFEAFSTCSYWFVNGCRFFVISWNINGVDVGLRRKTKIFHTKCPWSNLHRDTVHNPRSKLQYLDTPDWCWSIRQRWRSRRDMWWWQLWKLLCRRCLDHHWLRWLSDSGQLTSRE